MSKRDARADEGQMCTRCGHCIVVSQGHNPSYATKIHRYQVPFVAGVLELPCHARNCGARTEAPARNLK